MCATKPSSTIEPATVVRLSELVPYADASTVSRIISKSPAGNVTMFAFDEGQNLSEHTTPYDAVVQIIDGQCELIVGGRSLSATAGDVVLMPRNVPHEVKATKRFKMLLTMLKNE